MKSALFFLVLIAGGVVGYFWWQKTTYNGGKPANEPTVDQIVRKDIEDKISASGKVEAKGGLVTVLAEKDGKIQKVAPEVAVGNRVNQGQLLLQLDDSMAQHTLSVAEAAVKTANSRLKVAEASKKVAEAKIKSTQKELDYAKTMLESAEKKLQAGSAAEGLVNEARASLDAKIAAAEAANALETEAEGNIEAAKAGVQQATAGVTLAKRGVEQMQITSPCNGEILKVSEFVRDGQLIAPSMGALITIAPNPDQWEVKAQISEQDIGKLHNKLAAQQVIPVRFSTEAYSAEKQIKFTGKVMYIGALPNTNQRSSFGGGQEALLMAALAGGGGGNSSGPANYPVTISVDPIPDNIRKTHPLLVGYTATDLQIVINDYKNVVCVPSAALSFTPEGLTDAQQKTLKQNEEAGLSAIWFWNNGSYEPRYIHAGASEEGWTQVSEVKGGKPEDLLNKSVVTEGPKKPEKGNGLFGSGAQVKLPG